MPKQILNGKRMRDNFCFILEMMLKKWLFKFFYYVAAVLDFVAVVVFVVAAVVVCDCHQRKGDASVKYQQISRKGFLAKRKDSQNKFLS